MKASHREKAEPARPGLRRGRVRPRNGIDSQALDNNLGSWRGKKVAKDVLAIEIGNGDAEAAGAQFGAEQIRMHEEIGAVQREAEADLAHGRLSHPRGF